MSFDRVSFFLLLENREKGDRFRDPSDVVSINRSTKNHLSLRCYHRIDEPPTLMLSVSGSRGC
jgi:hypothetical protein